MESSEVMVREAVAADIPAMMEIRLSVTENVLSDPARITYEMYLDYLGRLGRSWVAVVDGTVIGFSSAARADASIWALFVRPEWEGRGAGKKLLTCAVNWLTGLGHAEVKLSTAADTRADVFYQSQGWIRSDQKDAIEVWYRLPAGASRM